MSGLSRRLPASLRDIRPRCSVAVSQLTFSTPAPRPDMPRVVIGDGENKARTSMTQSVHPTRQEQPTRRSKVPMGVYNKLKSASPAPSIPPAAVKPPMPSPKQMKKMPAKQLSFQRRKDGGVKLRGQRIDLTSASARIRGLSPGAHFEKMLRYHHRDWFAQAYTLTPARHRSSPLLSSRVTAADAVREMAAQKPTAVSLNDFYKVSLGSFSVPLHPQHTLNALLVGVCGTNHTLHAPCMPSMHSFHNSVCSMERLQPLSSG